MVKNPGASRPPPRDRPKNRLLRSLPDADFQRLLPDLRTVPTSAKQVFRKPNAAIEHVYFPNGGVASVTAVLPDGTMIETATVGTEGMVYREMPGLSLHLGQAARLFGLRPATCQIVLDDLVRRGVLRRATDGQYVIPEAVR
jgi:hypothetical protein